MVAATQATVIGSRYKLIANTESGDARLYDLQADPGETQNIAETSQAMVAHLDAMLHTPDLPSVRMEKTELDEDTREKLRSLGYVD